MTQFASFTINDGKATPVAHTFSAKSNDGRKTVWEDRSSGVPLAYPKVVLQTSDTLQIRKADISLTIPTLEAVSGANQLGFTPPATVAYFHALDIKAKLPMRGTLAERTDLYALGCNLLANAIFGGVIKTGEEITG